MPIIWGGSWARRWPARPTLCSTAMKRNAGRSRPVCSACPRICSKRPCAAICAAAARCSSSISAIRTRRCRSNGRSVMAACARAIACRMRCCAAPAASRGGSSTSLAGGHWTLLDCGGGQETGFSPLLGLRCHIIGPDGDMLDERGDGAVLLRPARGRNAACPSGRLCRRDRRARRPCGASPHLARIGLMPA